MSVLYVARSRALLSSMTFMGLRQDLKQPTFVWESFSTRVYRSNNIKPPKDPTQIRAWKAETRIITQAAEAATVNSRLTFTNRIRTLPVLSSICRRYRV